MFKRYLSIALRNLRLAPFTAFINVFTLALGLVAFVAAYAVAGYWNDSDRHFANADRTFVITSSQALADGSSATGMQLMTNELYQRYLQVEFPEFEAVAKALPWNREEPVTAGGRESRVSAVAVDRQFLAIFNLPFIAGDPASALSRPDGVVLSEEAAVRLFGSTDVLGRTVTLGGNLIDATVTGVIGAIPQPSHIGDSASAVLQLELISSLPLYERLEAAREARAAPLGEEGGDTKAESAVENWFGGYKYITYAMLQPGRHLSTATLNDRLSDFVKRHLTPEEQAFATVQAGVVPLSGLIVTQLNFQLLGSASDALSITTLLFGAGFLVLLVACVNYANLATARATRRAREIGLRKVLGARRWHIIDQHLCEAGLLTAAALAVAVLIIELLAPVIRETTGIDPSLSLFAGLGFWLFMAALIGGVTLMAGAYPAFVLSRAQPVEALRLGRMRRGSLVVSTALVGAQFAAASLLVIVVIVMTMQNAELERTGLGTTTDRYLVIDNDSLETGVDNELLRQELERLPEVKGVTQMSPAPWTDRVGITVLARTPEGAEASQTYMAFWNTVGYDFFSTFDMAVIAGRAFDRGRDDLPVGGREPAPPAPRNVVIDRAYAAQLGFAFPEQAVDALLYSPSRLGVVLPPRRIIGVVENRPLWLRGFGASANAYFLSSATNMRNQVVRLSARDMTGSLSAVEGAWRRLGALVPLSYRFMDEMFEESYRNFARIDQAFVGVAAFAMIIAFIGLFGMAIHTVGRRLHEVGVRKSLGAGAVQIAAMLLHDFSKWVVIGNLIAWPVAFFAVQYYLSIFLQRIDFTALPYMLSLGFVLAVAWAAVASQVLRAATVNPATVLRSE
jgi:putative ABC transport system permease protein